MTLPPLRRAGHAAIPPSTARRRVIRWFRRQGFLDAHAAAAMLAWEHGGVSIDASVRITLLDRDVPSTVEPLEHLLRYCGRPPFALQRRSGNRFLGRGRPGRREQPAHESLSTRAMLTDMPLTGLSSTGGRLQRTAKAFFRVVVRDCSF